MPLIDGKCSSSSSSAPADGFLLQLKIALWLGLIVAAPVWLYQLWAFIAPGLHRHERTLGVRLRRRWPRRCSPAGAVLAYFVVAKGLALPARQSA